MFFINQAIQPKIVEIEITNKGCDKLNFEIKKGTTVTWINNKDSSALLELGKINQPTVLEEGATYSMKFNREETFEYRCESKSGKIIVK